MGSGGRADKAAKSGFCNASGRDSLIPFGQNRTRSVTAPCPEPAPCPVVRRRLVTLSAALSLGLVAPWAAALDAAPGKIVLTISGHVAHANAGDRADFDMAMLEKLPQHSFTTATPWYPQPKTFTGPLLRDVLAAAGAKGTLLRAVALNDYKIDIPAGDAEAFDVIVARLLDGRPMAVRDKGPLFIVYPFDSRSDLRSERYYSRSAWQLRTLEVK